MKFDYSVVPVKYLDLNDDQGRHYFLADGTEIPYENMLCRDGFRNGDTKFIHERDEMLEHGVLAMTESCALSYKGHWDQERKRLGIPSVWGTKLSNIDKIDYKLIKDSSDEIEDFNEFYFACFNDSAKNARKRNRLHIFNSEAQKEWKKLLIKPSDLMRIRTNGWEIEDCCVSKRQWEHICGNNLYMIGCG